MKKSIKYNILLLLFCVFLLFLAKSCHEEALLPMADFSEAATIAPMPELDSTTEYVQTLPCLMDGMTGVRFQFANYSNRENAGTVFINIFQGQQAIGAATFDASKIGDGEYVSVAFEKKAVRGQLLEVRITSDSALGQGVTVWAANNLTIANAGGTLIVNDEARTESLNTTIEYQNPQLSKWFWVLLSLGMIVLFVLGLPQYYYAQFKNSKSAKKFGLYLVLLVVGTVVFSLRNLQFISTPIIYGEDGLFLARQLTNGVLPTLFTTRSGNPADFSNTGVYLLIWLGTKVTMLLEGYNIASYPVWSGIFSNAYLAFTAVTAYRAFELLRDKKFAVAAYFVVLLMPLGDSSCEVFGRPLNTAFLWIATVAFLLVIHFVNDYRFGIRSVFVSALCLIGAFTFPICFLEIGIYLVAVFVRAVKQRTLKKVVLSNWILCAVFVMGVAMLPRLLSSAGLGAIYTFKSESLIEFSMARHFLYPFVSAIYTHFNDGLTVFLFAGYLLITVAAGVIQIKKSKSLMNGYSLFAAIAYGACLASIYMRRTLTAVFDSYVTSYPDRYYWACNILAMLLFLYAVVIVLDQVHLFKAAVIALPIAVLLLTTNPNLFYFTKENYGLVLGSNYMGTLADNCVAAARSNTSLGDTIWVPIYPIVDPPSWGFGLPSEYVLVTAHEHAMSTYGGVN